MFFSWGNVTEGACNVSPAGRVGTAVGVGVDDAVEPPVMKSGHRSFEHPLRATVPTRMMGMIATMRRPFDRRPPFAAKEPVLRGL
jgi:hypothetical protein